MFCKIFTYFVKYVKNFYIFCKICKICKICKKDIIVFTSQNDTVKLWVEQGVLCLLYIQRQAH